MGFRSKRKADPAQETAIRKGAGPCAVIAGPGSGKTFVLVERIRYLIEERGVDPSSILVLTFSRAAAAHMRRRFLLSCPHPETVFGTFHSVFFRILQESGGKKVQLIDPGAKQNYLRHLCGLHLPFLPEKTNAEELQLLISRRKNGLPCRQNWVTQLVCIYDEYLEGRGWLDFDDMILRCRKLLQENPDTLAMWRERFHWILVDEFQDVSPSQYETLLLLAAPRNNLFIVGDDDQSIYGFRGADPLMMQRFLADFVTDTENEEERVVFLTTNYRCGKEILRASSSLIRFNKNRIDKDFRTGADLQGVFSCLPFSDRDLQYRYIVGELQKMTAAEREQTAVIFRTHGAAGQFLRLLHDRDMSFLAAGTGQKYVPPGDRTQILQDLTAYYRAAAGIGYESSGRGRRYRKQSEVSRTDLLRIMNRPERFLSGSFIPLDRMDREELLQNAGHEEETIGELIRDLELLNMLSPAYSMRYLMDSVGYRAYACAAYKKGLQILEEAEEETQDCASADQWLSYLQQELEASRLQDAADNMNAGKRQKQGINDGSGNRNESGRREADGKKDEAGERDRYEEKGTDGEKQAPSGVRILTMHACKGLEFDRVFIPDINEGSIPSKRSWTPDQVEEERRLLYVAMTRAKRSLTLTYMEGTPDRPAAPSRFLQSFIGKRV